MANLVSILKEEIIRLSRKEIRSEVEGLKKASAQYRSEIAALKRNTVTLQKQVGRLEKIFAKTTTEATPQPESARFTAKGFKTLRSKLGLSAVEAGRLIGVSGQTIYSWEAGTNRPRKQQLPNIVKLRGMGKKEVDALLQRQSK
jgi:DNA-binding transcriptional regulator YiaG